MIKIGFFKKLWNFVRLKGFQEDIIEDNYDDKLRNELKLEKSENLEIPKKEESRIINEKKRDNIKNEQQIFGIEDTTSKQSTLSDTSKEFEKFGKINDLTKKIKTTQEGKKRFIPTRELNELGGVYSDVIQNSTISVVDKDGKIDNNLLDVLIENRGKLQHRFSVSIFISTQGNQRGILSVDGLLAEHVSDIYDYINIGNTYTSEELKIAMNEVLKHFKEQYGAIGGNVIAPRESKSTVTNIEVEISFA